MNNSPNFKESLRMGLNFSTQGYAATSTPIRNNVSPATTYHISSP
jgi:hypothetical protein